MVRLKGGDPLIFGRGHEELRYLRAHGIEVEVVNGLTAGLAAATGAGIPLTDRACCHGVTFVTARTRAGSADLEARDWAALAGGGTTLVIYMGVACVERVADGLLRAGMDPDMPAVVVVSATLPQQRSVRCALSALNAAVQREKLRSPAIIIIGPVAALADPARTGETAYGFPPATHAGQAPACV